MSPQNWLLIIIALVLFDFVWNTFLGLLNQFSKPRQLPQELDGLMTETEFAKAQRYQKEHFNLDLLSSCLGIGLTLLILFNGWLGEWADYSRTLIASPQFSFLLFIAVPALLSDLIGLPFALYSTFVIEGKYGFNKTSPGLFVIDKLKGYAMAMLIGGGLLLLLFWLISTLGSQFWLWFWLIAFLLIVLLNTFYTSWILPLFNKLSPLPQGELRDAIVGYCHSVQFPLSQLFEMDGSKRSTKANAFFSGLGKQKKIVLYDTLTQGYSTEEIVAVIAHETGHYKKKHVYQGLIFSSLQMGIMLYLLGFLIGSTEISQALGAKDAHIGLNLIAFGLLFSPLLMLIGLAGNLISRKNEYEADRYARETFGAKALVTALKKLHKDSLSNLSPHPLYVFFHYSHPSLLQRIRALNQA
jgi:STE24 endopeptidase